MTGKVIARVTKKIGLLHHLGGGNLGDDASLDAVLQNIRARWPNAEISGFTMNPDYAQRRHGIPSYAIRRNIWNSSFGLTEEHQANLKSKAKAVASKYPFVFRLLQVINNIAVRMPRAVVQELLFLAKSFQIIRSFDLLVITGGGQLLDSWGGPWNFPYTIFKWTVLAKLSRVRCYFLNIGAGPLHYPLGRWFVKRALFLAEYVSFRDDESRTLLREIGYRKESPVHPDTVYSLESPSLRTGRNGGSGDSIVGISPMAYCDPRVYWKKDQRIYDDYIQRLAPFGSWLLQNHHSLVLFSTEIWFDSLAIKDFRSALEKDAVLVNSPRIKQEPISGIEGMLFQMSSMDYIVTCRFHGVVFAHLLNKPVLAISHHPKVSSLMRDMGLSNYCIDIHTCDSRVLTKTFQDLVNNRDEIKSLMAEKLACYKQELTSQLDSLFPREV